MHPPDTTIKGAHGTETTPMADPNIIPPRPLAMISPLERPTDSLPLAPIYPQVRPPITAPTLYARGDVTKSRYRRFIMNHLELQFLCFSPALRLRHPQYITMLPSQQAATGLNLDNIAGCHRANVDAVIVTALIPCKTQ